METNNGILKAEQIKEADKEVETMIKKSGIDGKFPDEIQNVDSRSMYLGTLVIKIILLIPMLIMTFLDVPSDKWYTKGAKWGLYITLLVDIVISSLTFSRKVKIPIIVTMVGIALKLIFFLIFMGILAFKLGQFILYVLIITFTLVSLSSELLFIVYSHKDIREAENETNNV